jgi:hypothetical protein
MNLARTPLFERSGPEALMASRTVSWAQLEPGEFEVRYGVIEAPPLTLSLRCLNLGVRGEVVLPPQSPMLFLASDDRTNARMHGAGFDSGSVATSSSVIDIVTTGPAAFYSVTIDERSLVQQFPSAPDAMTLLENIRGVKLADDPTRAKRVRAFFDRAFSTVLEPDSVYSALVPLLAETVEPIDDHAVEASKCLSRRTAAVRACETYIHEHLDTRVTMLDLCQVTGMRSRSLVNAFTAVTGLAPMEYV